MRLTIVALHLVAVARQSIHCIPLSARYTQPRLPEPQPSLPNGEAAMMSDLHLPPRFVQLCSRQEVMDIFRLVFVPVRYES